MSVPSDLIDTVAEITGVANSGAYPQIAMANALNDPALLQAAQAALGESGNKLFALDFSFLGIDLSTIPTWKFWSIPLTWSENLGPLVLVLISTCLSFLSMWISQKTNKMSGQQQSSGNSQTDKMTKQMMILMPIMSLWIGFVMPAALCVYWIANSLFTMLQELICGKLLKNDYEKAAAARAEQERLEKEEIKRQKAERAARIAAEQEEAKRNKGKKKPAAPKAKKKESTTEEGRVGIRPYARGRSYDPDRYGGVTEYRDGDAKAIPEDAVQPTQPEAETPAEELTAAAQPELIAAGETQPDAAPQEEQVPPQETPETEEEEVEEL
jgi:YidC/Oxa1 family membrane protein insertase